MREQNLLYASSHEWADLEGEICTVGITRFAIEQLTDITYIELPAVGKKFEKGKAFGVVESVKSANELYAPVSGEIVEVNSSVASNPMSLADDPYEKGWIVKLRVTGGVDTEGLLTKAEYDQQVAADSH